MGKIKLIHIVVVGDTEPRSYKNTEFFAGESGFSHDELEHIAKQLRDNLPRVTIVERRKDSVATTTFQTEHIVLFRVVEEVGE